MNEPCEHERPSGARRPLGTQGPAHAQIAQPTQHTQHTQHPQHQLRSPPAARRDRAAQRSARERILAAAVRQIARQGIDGVRIARIAIEARVSPALVHYHFATREALLAEALDYSYTLAGDARLEAATASATTHAQRLAAMIEQCLPSTPRLTEDWVLWVELWLRAVRHPQLRPFAEELYARLRAWFADEIAAGVADGEFAPCDPDDVADRTLALLDGLGIRALIGDRALPLERARRAVSASLARDLGLGERLSDPVGHRPQPPARPAQPPARPAQPPAQAAPAAAGQSSLPAPPGCGLRASTSP